MPNAKTIADKYISKGGGAPVLDEDEHVADVLTVASFLAWLSPDMLSGGQRASEAYGAFCRLVNIDRIALQKVVRDQSEHERGYAGNRG